MFGLDTIMRQVQEMQTKMASIQEELGTRKVVGASGGGMVTVICTGRQELVSITIDPVLMEKGDGAMLEDLVLTAVNEALRQAREMASAEVRAVTGGLNIPGLTL